MAANSSLVAPLNNNLTMSLEKLKQAKRIQRKIKDQQEKLKFFENKIVRVTIELDQADLTKGE